jgi:hypothetical protein
METFPRITGGGAGEGVPPGLFELNRQMSTHLLAVKIKVIPQAIQTNVRTGRLLDRLQLIQADLRA